MDPSIGRNRGHGGHMLVAQHNQPGHLKKAVYHWQSYSEAVGCRAAAGRYQQGIHYQRVHQVDSHFLLFRYFANATLQKSQCTFFFLWNTCTVVCLGAFRMYSALYIIVCCRKPHVLLHSTTLKSKFNNCIVLLKDLTEMHL